MSTDTEEKLLRYIELAARDSRNGCDEECQKEMERIRSEIKASHEELLERGRQLIQRRL